MNEKIACRKGCGACCIAPSLSSPIPGMPEGKPAGVRCVQLATDNLCKVFSSAARPAVCSSYRATREFCGETREDALRLLTGLEVMTNGHGRQREEDS
jgi:Fe-S-cluster containining protein